jgi:hypothetical protein
MDDESPGGQRIQHNGAQPGLLYIVDEPLADDDVYPHPNSSMPPGYEWLTHRPLRMRLIGAMDIQLSEEEEELKKRH